MKARLASALLALLSSSSSSSSGRPSFVSRRLRPRPPRRAVAPMVTSSSSLPPSAGVDNNDDHPPPSALRRAAELTQILGIDVVVPMVLSSLTSSSSSSVPRDDGWGGWDAFWSTESAFPSSSSSSTTTTTTTISHALRLARALEALGPTYVKFGQALGSRPDVVPPSLAAALTRLQDDMEPFDSGLAGRIILGELAGLVVVEGGTGGEGGPSREDLEALSSRLSSPVAAASIGQVYRATVPSLGEVAIKVRRPGVRSLVEADAMLLVSVAEFLESIPAWPSRRRGGRGRDDDEDDDNDRPARLFNTRLASAAREFMSRIFEELDYRNEASNVETFASLYSDRGGASTDVGVVVPRVYPSWCTENVLVMEWIDGTKLTDFGGGGTTTTTPTGEEEDRTRREENLALVKVAIDATLSQLLVTGILHADPHAGNLLKVRRDDGSVALGYLDFGLLSTIPTRVRDALICAVALQVFERDTASVSALFGELQLIPQGVLDDEGERAALEEALRIAFDNSLIYPKTDLTGSSSSEVVTAIPDLKFDKLLDSLSRLVPRFQFDLPPYFINNARALSTLEGIAKSLDETFNVLTIMYPYALNRLLHNPSQSMVVERTLQALIRSSDGKIDRRKIRRLLRDSASISGLSKRRVVWDVIKTRPGRKLTRSIVGEELMRVLDRLIFLFSRRE
ncbi:hypothetical protein ACHAW5_010081 [Stephanodiscus triporus]|uniref:ABC1 atypical kinase-like domain-containing protein n=1 Tax=Stephanodiscus triporus TaxID=2934178 RepID=A0ABD3NR63_9STRA